MIDPSWRLRLGQWRLPFVAAVIVLPVACYGVIRLVAHGFAGPLPTLHDMTLLGTSMSPTVLVPHFARCVNGSLSVGALLAVTWWMLRREGRDGGHPQPSSTATRRSIYGCLAVGIAILVQPAVLNPAWAVYNETRLANLGLVPLVAALALMIHELEVARGRSLSSRVAVALVGLLAVASLNHVNSVVGPPSKAATVTLQAIIGVALAVIILRSTPRIEVEGRGVKAKTSSEEALR
jgi:hypothetical protein